MKHKKHILFLSAFSLTLFFASCKKECVEPKEVMTEESYSPSASSKTYDEGNNSLDTIPTGLYLDKKTKKGSRSTRPNSTKLLLSSN